MIDQCQSVEDLALLSLPNIILHLWPCPEFLDIHCSRQIWVCMHHSYCQALLLLLWGWGLHSVSSFSPNPVQPSLDVNNLLQIWSCMHHSFVSPPPPSSLPAPPSNFSWVCPRPRPEILPLMWWSWISHVVEIWHSDILLTHHLALHQETWLWEIRIRVKQTSISEVKLSPRPEIKKTQFLLILHDFFLQKPIGSLV